MTYQMIETAWVEDDEIRVRVKRGKGGGMNLVLKEKDILKAKKDMHYSRPVKTKSQMSDFCGMIRGRHINVSSLGGDAKDSLKAEIKEQKRRQSVMSKSKKVEWKFRGNKDGKEIIQERLIELVDEIRKLEGVGKSGFIGWFQLKGGKDDTADELTIVGSFSKATGDSSSFDRVCGQVTKLLLRDSPNLEFDEIERKE